MARSTLLGRLVDDVERLRPGYLPAEVMERVGARHVVVQAP